MELKFPVGLEKNEVLIERDGIKIEVPWPVQIQILKERNKVKELFMNIKK